MSLKSGKKTLGRRLSFRKDKGPKRYWFVLHDEALHQYDKPSGKKIKEYLLSTVQSVDSDDLTVPGKSSNNFVLVDKQLEPVVSLKAASTNPNVTSDDYCQSWVSALSKALRERVGKFGDASNTALLS